MTDLECFARRALRAGAMATVGACGLILAVVASAAAKENFCSVLKDVSAQAKDDFKGIRLKEQEDEWTVKVTLPGMEDCKVDNLLNYSYVCHVRASSRKEADKTMARLRKTVGGCYSKSKFERGRGSNGLPTVKLAKVSPSVSISMMEAARRYVLAIRVN